MAFYALFECNPCVYRHTIHVLSLLASTKRTMTMNVHLDAFIAKIRAVWGPLTSELAASCRGFVEDLLRAPASEPWLCALHREKPASTELHRDAEHGFLLLAHTETAGLYRPPHDHGRSWVIYGTQSGEIEISTYGRVCDDAGNVRLVRRDQSVLRAGQAAVYLPGDIHDTRCLTSTALLYRFTERDLRIEDRRDGQVTRYAEAGGVWTTPRHA